MKRPRSHRWTHADRAEWTRLCDVLQVRPFTPREALRHLRLLGRRRRAHRAVNRRIRLGWSWRWDEFP